MPLQPQVDVEPVDLGQLLRLPRPGQRAGHADLLPAKQRPAHGDQVAVVLAVGVRGQTQVDAAFLGQQRCVDEGHRIGDHVGEDALDRRQLQRPDVQGGDVAAHLHGDALRHPGRHRREDPAQPLGQRQPGPDVFRDHAAGLHVDRVRHELPVQRKPDGPGDGEARLVLRLHRGRAQVRGHHHTGQTEQRAAGGWLDLEHVDAGAGHLAGPDGLGQGRLVDQAAAGGVDDPHPALRPGQLLGSDQPGRLDGAGKVDRDEVAGFEQLVQAARAGCP